MYAYKRLINVIVEKFDWLEKKQKNPIENKRGIIRLDFFIPSTRDLVDTYEIRYPYTYIMYIIVGVALFHFFHFLS